MFTRVGPGAPLYSADVPRHRSELEGTRHSIWFVAALGALAALCGTLAVLAALAPVEVNDPVVSWPQAGQMPTSTVVPLSPYRPLQLHATVPCRTLVALDGGGGGEALRTLPADAPNGGGQGLVVAVRDRAVHIEASGSAVLDERLPSDSCNYRVNADAEGLRVTRDGTELLAAPALLVPQVAELVTDARGQDTTGLSVQLHTDDRYNSHPSTLKLILLLAHGITLLVLLTLAWRARAGRVGRMRWPRPAPADAVVLVVSVAWAFLGPVSIDDSWYLLMARNAPAGGYVGNYINMFNSSENPFVLSQYAMQLWGAAGRWGLLWMRLLPVMYGLGTYLLLRVLLASVLQKLLAHKSSLGRRLPWALAVAHLLWWLPYGITLRPEPLVVFGSVLVLLFCEVARRRRSVGVLASATAVAALTLTASPAALVAVAPLFLILSWVWRWLRAAGWLQRLVGVLVLLAAGTAMVPVAFADASLGDVLESTSVRTYYYLAYSWYEENRHYQALLEGPWLARLPVLLTLAVLGAASTAIGLRRGTSGPLHKALLAYAAITLLALLALTPSPSKWVNHFGAVAAPAVVLLTLAMVLSPVPRRARASAAVLAAGLAIAAASVSFAGPNSWRPFSDWGQPFGTHLLFETPEQLRSTAPTLGVLEPRSPFLWLGVVAIGLLWARYRRRPRHRLTADRAVIRSAAWLGVVLALVVFVIAPIRQVPGPSVASVNLRSAQGNGCGLQDSVRLTQHGQSFSAARVIGASPVLADQVSASLWPCANLVSIANGMVQAPAYRIRIGDLLEGATGDNAYLPLNGGSFAAISRTARFVEMTSSLTPPAGVQILPWGHVEEVVYRYPVGLMDVQTTTVRRSGWARLPTLAVKDYTGRDNTL